MYTYDRFNLIFCRKQQNFVKQFSFNQKINYLNKQTLSKCGIAIFLRSKHLLILWMQSPSTFILEPKKMKSDTVSKFSPFICHKVIRPFIVLYIFWIQEILGLMCVANILSKYVIGHFIFSLFFFLDSFYLFIYLFIGLFIKLFIFFIKCGISKKIKIKK